MKMQKLKHDASKGTCKKAASEKDIKKKISPEQNNKPEESYAKDKSQRGSTCN